MSTYRLFYVRDDADQIHTAFLVSFHPDGRFDNVMKIDDPNACLNETIRFAKTVVTMSDFLSILANEVN